jgi:D-alanyl-D-alanine dipeptidase
MHSLANVALALVLFAARPAQGETLAPQGFVDAAAVVEGLVVDMRYFGDDNFVGRESTATSVRAACCRRRRQARSSRLRVISPRADLV